MNFRRVRYQIHTKPKQKEVIPMLVSRKERGQGLTEYALILILVALIVIAALSLLGPAIGNVFSNLIPQI
jgi:pilus assembly protein Flp/PilA